MLADINSEIWKFSEFIGFNYRDDTVFLLMAALNS